MLGEKDYDLIARNLDPHVSTYRVLYNDSNKRTHHQMKIQRRQTWRQGANDELE